MSTFLTYRNEIDIYTEDELKDKEFYKVLFSRLIENKININDITPLGARNNVIKRCETEPDNGRRKIFIIDGDVSIIHRNNIPILKNLFVLDAYCIENFVIDKQSVLNFIYLNCATKPKEEIEDELNFEYWLNDYSNKLVDLFIHFGITDFFGGKYKLFNAYKFHTKDNYSEEIVEQEIEKLKTEILLLTSKENYDHKYEELKIQWTNCVSSLITIVSGKDYLIPILLMKTQFFKKSKAISTVEEAKFLLVQNCNLDRLSKLKEAIEAL
ncbi:MAG: DUF4435 domain-containing protein [Candidatus Kapabacteria bacterium]|nr:DUF4435 domain-containing protein [Candidatus Kapabacteria bacterium]